MDLRLLPSDTQTESLVLASLMTDRDALSAVIPIMEADDFSLEANRRIFGIVSEIWRGGGVPDRVIVAQALQASKQLESVGGVGYLVDLEVGMPKLFDLDRFISRLRDLAIRRRMLRQLNALEEKIADQTCSIEEFAGALQSAYSDAISSKIGDDGLLTFREFLEQCGGTKAFLGPDTTRVIPTPWNKLTSLLAGGWRPGELTVLAARPGLGKSAAAGQISYAAAIRGANVDVFSLEMRNSGIWRRMLSHICKVSARRLRSSDLTQRDDEAIGVGIKQLSSMGALRISDRPHRTIGAIERVLRKAKSKRRLDLVVIDYLQLLRASRRSKSRVEEVSEITRDLKLLCNELDFSALILAQLNRDSVKDNRKPELHDLRECGSIEQDADSVMFIYQKPSDKASSIANATPCPTELLIQKQREGPLGVVNCLFDARYVAFDESPEERCNQY